MSSAASSHVARKIARLHGVESSYVVDNGSIDAVLETVENQPLRQHVVELGMRAMIPVRVFYRMPDGLVMSEAEISGKVEGIEDFYTNIHVAGFAGSDPSAPPDAIAGDAYGDKDVGKSKPDRDEGGQLKLTRIRSSSRGRPVVGWRYGDNVLRKGDKVKFKEPCVLQWTMGRTVKVASGMMGKIAQVSSSSPLAYLAIGGHDGIELPVHAIGHVFDVMLDQQLESKRTASKPREVVAADVGQPNEIQRLMMTVGFGHRPEVIRDTPKNTPMFRMPMPTIKSYNMASTDLDDADEDMMVPPDTKDGKGPTTKAPSTKKGDDRATHVASDEPKRILLARKR